MPVLGSSVVSVANSDTHRVHVILRRLWFFFIGNAIQFCFTQ